MQQYLDLVRQIFEQGSWQNNRTGVRTLSVPGAMLRFDLQAGFPAITTKKLAFKSVMGELVGFLRASRSAADLRALGCKVWDQNANENAQWLANPYRLREDDLGSVYGVQWRQWPAYKIIDPIQPQGEAQIADALGRGFQQIGVLDGADGKPSGVLLYKAVDQLGNAWTPSSRTLAAVAFSFTDGTGRSLMKWRSLPATCCTSSWSARRRRKSRCACTSGPTMSGLARCSTLPRARHCCTWWGA